MSMKKALSIIVVAVLLFTCVGCGEDPAVNSATTTTTVIGTTTADPNDVEQTTTLPSESVSSEQSTNDSSTKNSTTSSTTTEADEEEQTTTTRPSSSSSSKGTTKISSTKKNTTLSTTTEADEEEQTVGTRPNSSSPSKETTKTSTTKKATTTSTTKKTTKTSATKETTTTASTKNTITTSTTKKTTTTVSTTSTSRTSKFLTAKYRRYGKYITVRGGMKNTGYKIANDLELKVAFMGGSVTAGMGSSDSHKGGFRARLRYYMKEEYLSATFTEVSSTLGGNGSQYGVYITEQMIASEKPDLVFIEYAINNAYDGVKDADKLWNHYETMIHTIYKANPYADIVFLYVSDKNESDKDIIPILEEIAEKYQLTSINLHQAILDYIEGQDVKWSHYYGDDSVHCNDNGYELMGKVLHGAVQYGLSITPYTYAKQPCPAPKGTIQSEAKAVAATSCTVPSGWAKSSDFSYVDTLFDGCIQTTEADQTITVKFKGTDFGVLVEFAKDAGILEYSVDGGTYRELDCYLDYSNPKARMLLENAENTEHTITMRLGNSARMRMAIAAYLLNGTIISVG